VTLLKAILKLIYVCALVAFKIGNLMCPHLLFVGQKVIEFHRTQLSWVELLVEGTVLSLVILLFLFRRPILLAWRKLLENISKKSKTAAQAAPHILFFGCVIAISILGQKFLVNLSTTKTLPIVTVIIPGFSTAYLLFVVPEEKQKVHYRRKVSLWIILGTYHSCATLLSSIP
jgi:hypothetical protein